MAQEDNGTERDTLALRLLCAFNGLDPRDSITPVLPSWWQFPNSEVRDAWRRVAAVVANPGTATWPVPFPVGQQVRKVGGDYEWVGDVRACYQKRNGLWRVVSENDQGLNHIFSPNQLEVVE